MAIALIIVAAVLLAALQIFVKRQIRHNLTHFVRTGSQLPALPPTERWTLAVIAPYLMMLALPVDTFRAPAARRAALLSTLNRDWGIGDRKKLLKVLEHLRRTGYRAHCALLTGRPREDFLAWDLMRAILLAWLAVNLEWTNYDEFLLSVTTDGNRLQHAFGDWESAAESYQAGLTIWATQGKLRSLVERTSIALNSLRDFSDSPWKLVEWRTSLPVQSQSEQEFGGQS